MPGSATPAGALGAEAGPPEVGWRGLGMPMTGILRADAHGKVRRRLGHPGGAGNSSNTPKLHGHHHPSKTASSNVAPSAIQGTRAPLTIFMLPRHPVAVGRCVRGSPSGLTRLPARPA